jgi:hypothetical protein
MFSAGLISPAPDGSQGHVSSHAERLRDLPLSRERDVTRYFVGGAALLFKSALIARALAGWFVELVPPGGSPRPPGRFLNRCGRASRCLRGSSLFSG